MRLGTLLIVIWLFIGGYAAYQRGYLFGNTQVSCTGLGTVALTVVAGPLNYLGLNPKIECTVPQPSP